MRGRRFVRDLIWHLLVISAFAVGLVLIWQKVEATPELRRLEWLTWLLYASFAVLAVLVLVFARNLFTNTYLERFDPGRRASLERLERIRRFQLKTREREPLGRWQQPVVEMGRFLDGEGFQEAARWAHGIIYERPRRAGDQSGRRPVDLCFVLYRPMVNVLVIDYVFKECMAYLDRALPEKPTGRHYLIFVTDMQDRGEVTSSAAAVVNFPGRIPQGSLGPLLLDVFYGRLFYPLDRSLLRPRQRRSQNRLRRHLRCFIREGQRQQVGVRAGRGEREEAVVVRPVVRKLTIKERDVAAGDDE